VIPRNLRPLVALAALLTIAAAVASGCSSTMRDAATVRFDDEDGAQQVVHISRDDFENDLRQLSENDQIMQSLEQSGVEARPDGSAVDANLSALWMNTLINSIAIDAEFEGRGLELTDEEREQAAAGFTAYEDLPEALRNTLIVQQAKAQSLVADFASEVEDAPEPTDEELRAVYEQNLDALTACTTGKEVSHILVEDEAAANEIAQQLADGAPFAEIAATRSTDTGSAAQGGSLGCLGAQPFVEPFQVAADGAPLDQVVGPVQSEFGYHLVLVTAWNPTFEKLRETLAQQVASQAQQATEAQRSQLLNEAITARLQAMDVDLDPRFGTWEENDGVFQVVAPDAPSPRDQREPSTTTTSLPAVIGG
jgi:parvulin-like peptidyl-prolyl isomerase